MSIKINKILANKYIKQFILFTFSFILFWFYIYHFKLVGFPLATNQILLILGCVSLFFKIFYKKDFNIDKDCIRLIFYSIIPVFFVLITSIINGQNDFSIRNYLLGLPYSLLSFYFFKFFKNESHQKITFNEIALLFILTGFVQGVVSLIGFLIPNIGDFLIRIQAFDSEASREFTEGQFSIRLIGFGTKYFTAGIIYSIDLVLITQLMFDNTLYKEKYYKLLPILFIVIFCCGMMTARTTIVGLFFSSFYFFKNSLRKIFHVIKTILPIFIAITLMITILFYLYGDRLKTLFNFGFELFLNLSSGKGFNTGSSNATLRMIKFPDENDYKTWLIGDALFISGSRYYMHTDVGYCRSLFYFGVIGTLSLFLAQAFILVSLINRLDKKYRFFLLVLGLMFLTFNIKGFAVIYVYLIPFYYIEKRKLSFEFEKGKH